MRLSWDDEEQGGNRLLAGGGRGQSSTLVRVTMYRSSPSMPS
jgi:hypothetical protein